VIFWIDAQLSPALARWLSDTFGVTAYAVRDLGFRAAKDLPIFHAARQAGAVIMSKDSYFCLIAGAARSTTPDSMGDVWQYLECPIARSLPQELSRSQSALGAG
jgi:predicted nuclease of predicted toxin-antitoxin system